VVVCGLIKRWSADEDLLVAQEWGWYTNGEKTSTCRRRGDEKRMEIWLHGAIALPNEQNLKEQLIVVVNDSIDPEN
jgi:hypothetical protein